MNENPYPTQPSLPPSVQPGAYPPGPQPGQAPMQVLPYHGPQMGMPMAGAWKDKTVLIVTRVITLPHVCVKCGQPASKRLKQTFFWHEPWIYLLILAGLLVYIIVALVLRKKATVDMGLCEHHASRRSTLLWTFWLLCLLGGISFVGGIALASSGRSNEDLGLAMLLIGFFSALIFAIVALVCGKTLKLLQMDDRFAYLKGAHPQMLAMLPKANPWS